MLFKEKFSIIHHYQCQGKQHFFFALGKSLDGRSCFVWNVKGRCKFREHWRTLLVAVKAHSCFTGLWISRKGWVSQTVLKCCITSVFNEAEYSSFLHSLFQTNFVLDQVVCWDCRGTGQEHSCSFGAAKLSFLCFIWNTNYPLQNLTLTPLSLGGSWVFFCFFLFSWDYKCLDLRKLPSAIFQIRFKKQFWSWGVILDSSV